MKKLALIFTAMFFIGSLTTNAQMRQGQNQQKDQQQSMMMQKQGMMQGGRMMQNMMGNGMCPMCGMMMNQKMPMMKYMMMVNKLPNMQDELALTYEQLNNMIDLQTEFKKQQVDYRAEFTKKQMKLEKMLNNMPSADELKKQMKQCADAKINMKVAAYETVKKMKALLTEEQKKTLKSTMKDQDHEEHH